MVYITKSGRRLPDKIRFDPEEARRIVPDKLVQRGLFATREEAVRAVELLISISEKEETGAPEKNE